MKKLMEFIQIKKQNKIYKYSIRRLSIGVMSCVIGLSVFLSPNLGYAVQNVPNAATEVVSTKYNLNDYEKVEKYTTIVGDAEIHVYVTRKGGIVERKDKSPISGTFPLSTGSKEFKAIPNENWVFKKWEFEQFFKGTDLGNRTDKLWEYSFTMSDDRKTPYDGKSDTIQVNRISSTGETTPLDLFGYIVGNKLEYKVYAKLNPMITKIESKDEISTENKEEVEYKSDKSYEIKSPENYVIGSISVDGKPIEIAKELKDYNYEFKSVVEPHTIKVDFVKEKEKPDTPKKVKPVEPKKVKPVEPKKVKPVEPKKEDDNNYWIRLDITHLSPTKLMPPKGKEDKKEKVELHEAYLKGYPDGTIKPQGNVTRAEAAALVARLEKLDLNDTTKPSFKDMEENVWFTPYINAVVKRDLLLADENGNIRPNEPITRAEFARMLAPIDKKNSVISTFTDIKGHKYEAAINQEFGNKTIEGYEDGTFRPEGVITRAETVAMLNRKYNRIADVEAMPMNYKNQLAKFTDLVETEWYYYDIVEAANSHKATRKETKDKYGRNYESWKEIIKN